MAHSYYERETFYGIQLNYILPFNFLRSFHLQAPIIWIGLGWIASGLFIAPAIAGGREAKGQGFLVDLLFWVSLVRRRRRADRQLSRHPGSHRQRLVLVRQPGPVLHPARPFLADPVLRRAVELERPDVPGAVAKPRHAGRSHTSVLDRRNPAGASDLGRDHQRRRSLRLRHDPADGHREELHHHRLLALVGRPSVGRAIVRVLRGGDERLSADVARPGLAQARRTVGLSRAHPDLPRRRARHRPPSLLGRRSGHVGAAGLDVLVHRGAAAGASDPRGHLAAPR